VRTRKDLEEAAKNAKKESGVTLARASAAGSRRPEKGRGSGRVCGQRKKSRFPPVETGISA